MSDYRYTLTRDVAPLTGHGTVLWVMLNPSTADEHTDDPTIRRCIRFTREWGHARLVVVNLYAMRATDPTELATAVDPVGPRNDWTIAEQVDALTVPPDWVVCAWGGNAGPERAAAVLDLIDVPAIALAVNADGTPRHPLYVPADTVPVPFGAAVPS